MKLVDIDYHLPEERIAQQPLANRDASRLLVLRRSPASIAHHGVRDLPGLLQPGDVLVRNVTRVWPARLLGRRASGGRVELLLVDEDDGGTWRALARPARRLLAGERLRLASGFEIDVAASPDSEGYVRLRAPDLRQEADRHGLVPLPPYIHRPPTDEDLSRYQTVYARDSGSVAAPTAGLHFTESLLEEIARRDVVLCDVTLSIGPGTFLPIRSTTLETHRMHPEAFEVPQATVARVRQARACGRRVVAVGTSTARALEAAALHGELRAHRGMTDLFIRPGHTFRVVTALLTNFHQPRSTLLALVAALAGLEPVRQAYEEALREGYRFLSYGDAMLVD